MLQHRDKDDALYVNSIRDCKRLFEINKKKTGTHTPTHAHTQDTFDKEQQNEKSIPMKYRTAIKFNKSQSINQWAKWMNRHCVDNHFRHDICKSSLL